MSVADTQGHANSCRGNWPPRQEFMPFSWRAGLAGWQAIRKLPIPDGISFVLPPPRLPERDPVENLCKHLRQMRLSDYVFETSAHRSSTSPSPEIAWKNP